jgi:DNA-binding MurR/RpiR family transcriptional regulator
VIIFINSNYENKYSMIEPTLHDSPLMQTLQQALSSLSPALRKVADFLLRHPLLAATHSIEELAQATGVSAAAVNRLANSLGYQGFGGLKAELTAALQEAVSPVSKLRQQIGMQADDRVSLSSLLSATASNLAFTADRSGALQFELAVALLASARRVFCLGFGNSAYLAGLAAANLAPFCDAQAISLEGGNENAAYRLATIRPEDVLLAISLPRYSRDTVQLARFAVDRGATLLVITDSPASPLAALSSHVLYAVADHPVLAASGTAALALIESLVSAVMVQNKEAVRLSAELSESMLQYLYWNDSAQPPKHG